MNNNNSKNLLGLLLVCGVVGHAASIANADPIRLLDVQSLRIILAHNEQGGLRHAIEDTASGFDCRGMGVWVTSVRGSALGAVGSTVTGISPDGLVAVGWSLAPSNQGDGGLVPVSFVWTPCGGSGTVGNDVPGSVGGQALAASVGGQVVVGVSHGSTDAGVRLFGAETADGADVIFDQTNQYDSALRAVSADGNVVVGYGADVIGRQALVFVNGWDHVRSLGDLLGGNAWSDAFGVSADGSVIVGQSLSASGPQAFIWNDDTGMVGLGDLSGGAFDSAALAVSANGRVVVGVSQSASGPQAFRWTAETGMVGLGDLPGGGFGSEALGVSADGSVIVGRSLTANGYEAFIWEAATGMQNLRTVIESRIGVDVQMPMLTAANGVSADGSVIGGSAINDVGVNEGWVAHLPARPCSADWNQDGLANSLDFFAFLTDFFQYNADLTGDGITDTSDFFAFLTAFFTGCP